VLRRSQVQQQVALVAVLCGVGCPSCGSSLCALVCHIHAVCRCICAWVQQQAALWALHTVHTPLVPTTTLPPSPLSC
jgi:hypothetical protein